MRSYLRSRSAAVVMSVIVVSFCAAATVRADDPPYVTPGTGGAASASPETSRDMSRTANAWNTINGTITAVGQSTVDVTTDRGESFTFLTDEISNVPSTLSVGDSVAIQYHPVDSGVNRIGTVTFVAAAAPPAAPPAAPSNPPAVSEAPPPPPPAAPPPEPAPVYTPPAAPSEPAHVAELPRTAGRLPLVAILGALSLAAAFGVRMISVARAHASRSRVRF